AGVGDFFLASAASGAALASSSAKRVLPVILGASALLLLTCLCVPLIRLTEGTERIRGIRAIASDGKFWLFVIAASALQASHQVYWLRSASLALPRPLRDDDRLALGGRGAGRDLPLLARQETARQAGAGWIDGARRGLRDPPV